MIRALIFDFDGLILDTEIPVYQTWQEVFQAHGCSLPLSSWAPLIGNPSYPFNPFECLEEQLGRPVDREEIGAKRKSRVMRLLEAKPVLPGVEDYISNAKRLGLKLAVASSSTRHWVTSHLSRLGLIENFDVIRCGDEVKHTKPNPELYLSALDALSLRADQAIALEDSPAGTLAANSAGLFCVVVPNLLTRQLCLDKADLLLTSLADLPLEKLLLEAKK